MRAAGTVGRPARAIDPTTKNLRSPRRGIRVPRAGASAAKNQSLISNQPISNLQSLIPQEREGFEVVFEGVVGPGAVVGVGVAGVDELVAADDEDVVVLEVDQFVDLEFDAALEVDVGDDGVAAADVGGAQVYALNLVEGAAA